MTMFQQALDKLKMPDSMIMTKTGFILGSRE